MAEFGIVGKSGSSRSQPYHTVRFYIIMDICPQNALQMTQSQTPIRCKSSSLITCYIMGSVSLDYRLQNLAIEYNIILDGCVSQGVSDWLE